MAKRASDLHPDGPSASPRNRGRETKDSVRLCRQCKKTPALPEREFCSEYCEMMFHKEVDRGPDNRWGHEPEATVGPDYKDQLDWNR